MLATGSTIAGYRIERVLGRGGMGVVYEATQLSLERTVALKVIAAELSGDSEFSERFRREGRIQAALEHPHIITVYEAGESEEGLFLAMRLVRGPNLKDLVLGRELDATRALRVLTQVADALDTAHAAGLVHRDIKPHNVLVAVGARDHAYLADFGVTKDMGRTGLTRSGQLVGTLDYMPPEQIEGHSATSRSDIYSFGAVLYESLTGVVPYAKKSDAAVLYAHLREPPPKPTAERPELPAALDSVLEKAMAKKPEERYRTANEMMIDVDAAFGGRAAATAPAPGPIERAEEIGVRRAEEDVSTPASPRDRDTTPAAPAPGTALAARRRESEAPPTLPAEPPAPPAQAERPARRGALAILTGAAVVLAVAGFFGGRLVDGDGGGSGLGTTTSAGLAVAVPAGWRAAAPPAIPGLRFGSERIALAPAAAASGLVAGRVDAAYPAFLPASLVARLDADPTAARKVVGLGSIQAYRYGRLAPAGFDGVLTVYAVPQAGDRAVLVVCYAPTAASLAPGCDRSAASLKTTTGTNVPIVSPTSYATAVAATFSRLDDARAAALRRLRGASTRAGQGQAAGSAASAYRAAAKDLDGSKPSEIARRTRASVLSDLRAAAAAFDRLRAAALGGNAGAYRSARRRVERVEQRLDDDVGVLTKVVVARG